VVRNAKEAVAALEKTGGDVKKQEKVRKIAVGMQCDVKDMMTVYTNKGDMQEIM
jgi:hypothetical protein